MKKIKLLICDIDGTLTDGTVSVSEKGEETKRFSLKDGRGFHLLKTLTDVKTMFLTSENGGINAARAEKLIKAGGLDYFADGSWNLGKVEKAKKVMKELNIDFDQVAFIGDDTNDLELLSMVAISGCPNDSNSIIREIEGINIMNCNGGHGAVREFIDWLFRLNLLEGNK
jgi:YrbI family 3-deoxy-D-manno-octulosonate 8-phosphate phosphatase